MSTRLTKYCWSPDLRECHATKADTCLSTSLSQPNAERGQSKSHIDREPKTGIEQRRRSQSLHVRRRVISWFWVQLEHASGVRVLSLEIAPQTCQSLALRGSTRDWICTIMCFRLIFCSVWHIFRLLLFVCGHGPVRVDTSGLMKACHLR
jgi:hypothetical protein